MATTTFSHEEEDKEAELQLPKKIQIRNTCFSNINSFTRDKFHVKTEGSHRLLTAMEGDPVFIINPSLAGSWVTTPKPIFPDTVGYWSRHTKIPRLI